MRSLARESSPLFVVVVINIILGLLVGLTIFGFLTKANGISIPTEDAVLIALSISVAYFILMTMLGYLIFKK